MIKLIRRIFNSRPFYDCEICQKCYRRVNQVWHAPDYLWKQTTGWEEGVLCLECFSEMAYKQNIFLYWTCAENEYPNQEILFPKSD